MFLVVPVRVRSNITTGGSSVGVRKFFQEGWVDNNLPVWLQEAGARGSRGKGGMGVADAAAASLGKPGLGRLLSHSTSLTCACGLWCV